MKKIISLVVAAMMIMSLFAVNVGAVVTHGDSEADWLAFVPPTDPEAYIGGTWKGQYVNGADTVTIEDGTFILTNAGQGFDTAWDPSSAGVVFPVSGRYNVYFSVDVVDNSRGLNVTFTNKAGRKDSIAIYGASLTKGSHYDFVAMIDESKAGSTQLIKLGYNKDGEGMKMMAESGHTWDYSGQLFNGSYGPSWTDANPVYRCAYGNNNTSSAGFFARFRMGAKKEEATTAEEVAAAEYHISNIAVKAVVEANATGIQASQDFEDATNAVFTKASEGPVTLAKKTEDGNTYMNMVDDTKYLGMHHFGTLRSEAKLAVDDNFAIQFDFRANNGNLDRFAVVAYTSAGSKAAYVFRDFTNTAEILGNYNIPATAANSVELNKWYTFKISVVNGVVKVYRADRGANNWISVSSNATNAAGQSGVTSGRDNEIVFTTNFGFGGKNNISDIDLDNIYVTKAEQTSFGEITADESMVYIPEFEFEDGAAYGDANLTAVIAAFDGDGKLVDATFQTANAVAGYAKFTDLGMRSSGDKVYLYVWDTLANAKPVMDTPYLVYSAQ